jgi:glycerol-3-phosphate acyltransferase PlsY
MLVADVLKGVGAIIVARSFCPWLYTELSPTPPTAFDLQIWVPWAVCWPELPCCLGIAARFG